MSRKYSGEFDDHPDMIALCLGCKRKTCSGNRCTAWVRMWKRLAGEDEQIERTQKVEEIRK